MVAAKFIDDNDGGIRLIEAYIGYSRIIGGFLIFGFILISRGTCRTSFALRKESKFENYKKKTVNLSYERQS